MHPVFATHVGTLEQSLQRLCAMTPVRCLALPKGIPRSGVYLFSEGESHLYVGRSDRMHQRVRNHGRPGSTHNQAAFAMRLAREATGKTKASYKPEGSCKHLVTMPDFAAAFSAAKARVALMDVRFVEETDPLRQALLEMYVATALESRYNDFENH